MFGRTRSRPDFRDTTSVCAPADAAFAAWLQSLDRWAGEVVRRPPALAAGAVTRKRPGSFAGWVI